MSDVAMARKVLNTLKGQVGGFYCHDGHPVDEHNAYQPPRKADGTYDRSQMEQCGGYLRWALTWRERPAAEQRAEVDRLQRRMLERMVANDTDLQAALDGRGIDLETFQRALNWQADREMAHVYGPAGSGKGRRHG